MKFKRIMIVDDDPEFSGELKDALLSVGFSVTVGRDILNGTKKALETKPEVVLVELSVKPGGGFRFAEELRRRPETSRIPVIYMTGYYSLLEEYPGERIFLKRHFNPEEILEQLDEFLDEFR